MSVTRPSPLAKAELPTAQIAKAALRRLAAERLEPTPENYERAYRQEAGEVPESSEALAVLIERIVRGMERTGHNWTPARRKEGIQRVLASGRGDARKLQHRLSQLVNSWEADSPATPVGVGAPASASASLPMPLDAATAANTSAAANDTSPAANDASSPTSAAAPHAWERVARTLGHALQ